MRRLHKWWLRTVLKRRRWLIFEMHQTWEVIGKVEPPIMPNEKARIETWAGFGGWPKWITKAWNP